MILFLYKIFQILFLEKLQKILKGTNIPVNYNHVLGGLAVKLC